MSMILALALAAQIHTGHDLLNACKAHDKSACEAFIRQSVLSDSDGACIGLKDKTDVAYVRSNIVEFVGKSPEMQAGPARNFLYIYECGAAD